MAYDMEKDDSPERYKKDKHYLLKKAGVWDKQKKGAKQNALNKKKEDGRSGGLKRTMTRSEFNKVHSDYKGYREFGGVKKHPYVLRNENGATVYAPVKIRPENKGKTYIHTKNK